MRFINQLNTFWNIQTENTNNIEPFIMFICSSSGKGKGLAEEGILERLHKLGFLVLVLADPKKECEFGFAMFKPKEYYHLEHLNKIGVELSTKKVKLYHPFTFSIPHSLLPEINFYTFSIKDMTRREWSMILETEFDTEAVRLLLNASKNISDNEGIIGLLHTIYDLTKSKKQGRILKSDPKNFLLPIPMGSSKSIQDISSYLQLFKQDMFLASESCKLNLNWKDILSDQEHYHVFLTNWIYDKKLIDLTVLALLNQVLEHKDYARTPICIVIPEVRKQLPFRPRGHEVFLAEIMKESFSTMRAMGRGMCAIMDSQSFRDTNESVKNSATITLFGELSPDDAEDVAKTMNYRRDIRTQLNKMEYRNSFLVAGHEDIGAITPFFASHMHCEPSYNFFEMYKRYFPEKMRSYINLIKDMKIEYSREENTIREKIRKIEQKEKERLEAIKKEKDKKESIKDVAESKIKKAKEIESKNKKELMRLVYEAKEKFPDKKWRELGREFGINHITAKNYYNDYEKSLEEENEMQEVQEDNNELQEE